MAKSSCFQKKVLSLPSKMANLLSTRKKKQTSLFCSSLVFS